MSVYPFHNTIYQWWAPFSRCDKIPSPSYSRVSSTVWDVAAFELAHIKDGMDPLAWGQIQSKCNLGQLLGDVNRANPLCLIFCKTRAQHALRFAMYRTTSSLFFHFLSISFDSQHIHTLLQYGEVGRDVLYRHLYLL